jgi:hypothetical protein
MMKWMGKEKVRFPSKNLQSAKLFLEKKSGRKTSVRDVKHSAISLVGFWADAQFMSELVRVTLKK